MNENTVAEQTAIPCVLMRGGTSKALFFHEADVPPAGPARARFLQRAMGTPDVLQIDGMGGSRLVTSKVAIIKRSQRADADVDYTFAQLNVEREGVFFTANCGNISSAVGPFSIDEGLVEVTSPITTVRIYNTNTDKLLVSKVQVAGGKARVLGDCAIAGVPGTGAEIIMDFSGAVGSKAGRLLPTGHATDVIKLEDGRTVTVTICDVGNPCVFMLAADLGLTGSELPVPLTTDKALMETVGEVQAKAGQMIGLWPDWKTEHLPGIPSALIVAPPADYVDVNGKTQLGNSMDARERFVFLGKCHDSMAGVGAVCSAAASRVKGSVLNKVLPPDAIQSGELRIGHPLGVMAAKVTVRAGTYDVEPAFDELGVARTARRLMDGFIYVPTQDIV